MDHYIFDAVEYALRDRLSLTLTEPVYVEAPEEPPAAFVQIERTGGVTGLVRDRPTVIFTCWAATRGAAAQLAQTVHWHARRIVDVNGSSVNDKRTVLGPVYRPEPTTGAARYQFTMQYSIRGRKVEAS